MPSINLIFCCAIIIVSVFKGIVSTENYDDVIEEDEDQNATVLLSDLLDESTLEPPGRTVNGELISIRKYPFLVSLQDRRKYHYCVGVIIDPSHVLTSAVCMTEALKVYKSWRVVAGRSVPDEPSPESEQILGIREIISHEGLTLSPRSNDIAIVKVEGTFVYTEFVNEVILNQNKEAIFGDIISTPVFVYGVASYGGDSLQSLQYKEMRVGRHTMCKKKDGFDGETMICLKGRVTDNCSGDDGGPALNSFSELIGLEPVGLKSCGAIPNFYTNISLYYNWIMEKTQGTHLSIAIIPKIGTEVASEIRNHTSHPSPADPCNRRGDLNCGSAGAGSCNRETGACACEPGFTSARVCIPDQNIVTIDVLSSRSNVSVWRDGKQIFQHSTRRGLNIIILDNLTGSLASEQGFDTWSTNFDAQIISFLDSVDNGDIIIFTILDEGSNNLGPSTVRYIESLGSKHIHLLKWRDMWVFSTRKNGQPLGENYVENTGQDWASDALLQVKLSLRNVEVESKRTCDAGWSLFCSTKGCSCYLTENSKASWMEGHFQCKVKGGNLVTIFDLAEHNFVKELIKDNLRGSDTWIGMNNFNPEGVFQWEYGVPINFTSWYKSEPNKASCHNYASPVQNCGVMWGSEWEYGWGDECCRKLLPYICKK